MTQVPKNPPPWGPRRDPHFDATHTFEGYGVHTQVDVTTAILKYEESELSQADLDILYTGQNAGTATGPIAG
jgi:hypothetical protein